MSMVDAAWCPMPMIASVVSKQTRRLLLLACAISVWSCSSENALEQAHQDYTSRLSRVLDTPLTAPTRQSLLPFPDSHELRQTPPAIAIKLSEFYALDACQLASEVAARNTALGKVQLPSQRYVYELSMLELLDACLATPGHSQAMSAQLETWLSQKRESIQYVWANMLLTSQATRLAFSHSPNLLNQSSNQHIQSAVNALSYLSPADFTVPVETEALEQQLHLTQQTRLPVRLWSTQAFIASHFSVLTTELEAQLPQVNCPEGRASEQAKILRNVFYLFFVEEIQPVGSIVNTSHYQLAPVINRWLNTPALPEAFKHYLFEVHVKGFESYQQQMRRHVELWQAFLGRCNLSPVAPQA